MPTRKSASFKATGEAGLAVLAQTTAVPASWKSPAGHYRIIVIAPDVGDEVNLDAYVPGYEFSAIHAVNRSGVGDWKVIARLEGEELQGEFAGTEAEAKNQQVWAFFGTVPAAAPAESDQADADGSETSPAGEDEDQPAAAEGSAEDEAEGEDDSEPAAQPEDEAEGTEDEDEDETEGEDEESETPAPATAEQRRPSRK